jgi:ParB family chromosome partitioning protein
MTELQTIKLADIHVPERLRKLDLANAMFIADSVKRQGLMHPITVRRTPRAKGGKFTLVAGRHRMEAVYLNDLDEIDAFIVKADETGARLKEIEENLFRNDLSQLDRAVFVTEFRRLWEAEHGEINPKGGRPDNRDKLSQLSHDTPDKNQTDMLSLWSMSEHGGSFIQTAAERLGIHERSVKRLQRVGLQLDPELRRKLTGRPEADNLSLLTKLVDLGPEKQAGVLRALESTKGDIKKAIAATQPAKKKPSAEERIWSTLISTWDRTNAATRKKFYAHIQEQMVEELADGD